MVACHTIQAMLHNCIQLVFVRSVVYFARHGLQSQKLELRTNPFQAVALVGADIISVRPFAEREPLFGILGHNATNIFLGSTVGTDAIVGKHITDLGPPMLI